MEEIDLPTGAGWCVRKGRPDCYTPRTPPVDVVEVLSRSERPMLYSATIEYALRALAHIATLEPGERILARDLAAATDVPRQFLGKILHRLAKVDLLASAKGRGGGFRFQRPPEEIVVSDVVVALEGGDITKQCVLGLDECNDEQPCPMHDQWKVFRTALSEKVYAMTVADLGANLKRKRALHSSNPPATPDA
jgi:Rrf2 family iron-sulfur cluster assembly transcriptional regulator